MASERSEMVRNHWRRITEAAVAHPNQTPAELRRRVERYWPALTAEPGGVDYLEVEVGGLPALWAVPKHAAEDRVIFGVHGGGGVSGSIYTHRKLFADLAKAVGARALLVEYREAPYPGPLDDVTAAYRWLLDQGVDPRHTAFVGDSIGGNLAVSTGLRAHELGLPLPAALMLISPLVDLTVSNQTYESNRESEEFFYKEVVSYLVSAYLAGAPPGIRPSPMTRSGSSLLGSDRGSASPDERRPVGETGEGAARRARITCSALASRAFHDPQRAVSAASRRSSSARSTPFAERAIACS
jgi:epsilon-lactone hydrolase